ncbi:DEAD/DEAH box helicase family protein [archaeon]|jgi:superfamily II DNA or RNA helicase|nr:DEAD/DEAH box helicase family protein [archaeon]MBT3578139.1 DEAD/DEAH box helicase family protein [archaeon]MBT6820687.1 DEAD/DEAH box helicase family protein [archaeon]MBT6955885.1 DEAD/DEAH box helicase family protein [archaeon]MBT7024903.1 DEAD/DEAH box helicase family protein [archaeon]
MTGLKELSDSIEKIYDSDSEDITEIMNLLLKQSIRYSRIGSYFSSKSFISLAEGLEELFLKNGKMKLIINYELSKEDHQELKKTCDYQKIGDRIALDIKNLKSEMELNSAKVLAWLIYQGKLEIKVVLGKGNNLMHIKQGIFEDEYGDKVAFTGSANETYSAYEKNIEQVTFFKDWISGQEEYVGEFISKFNKFWDNCGVVAKTYSLSKAFENELMRIRPRTEAELKESLQIISSKNMSTKKKKSLTPYPHQDAALQAWLKNDKRGIIEMPTGCGKTKTALFAFRKAIKSGKSATFIFAPTKAICNQWIEEFEGEPCKICKIYDNPNWKRDLKKNILDLKLGVFENLVVVGSYALITSKVLIEEIRTLTEFNKFLIADEAHSTGALKTSGGLIEDYNFRLALSATPKRYLDEDGTNRVFDFFGGVVYDKIGLYEAIYSLGVLCEYEYHLIQVFLNEEEMAQYSKLTKLLIMKVSMKSKDKYNTNLDSEIQRLAEKRAKIIKNCSAKLDKLPEIVEEIKEDKSIIFVSPKQREEVLKIVRNRIKYHQYTYSEDTEVRSRALENFKEGKIQALVAIKCLDEGLDVPAARAGVIMASSGNPREFIQRRGRLLRKHPNKKYAKIFDFFVTPSKEAISSSEMYKNQISKELKRITEFAKSARNEIKVSKELKELKSKLGL